MEDSKDVDVNYSINLSGDQLMKISKFYDIIKKQEFIFGEKKDIRCFSLLDSNALQFNLNSSLKTMLMKEFSRVRLLL